MKSFTFYVPMKYWNTLDITLRNMSTFSKCSREGGTVTVTVEIDSVDIPNFFLSLGLNIADDHHNQVKEPSICNHIPDSSNYSLEDMDDHIEDNIQLTSAGKDPYEDGWDEDEVSTDCD